MTDALSTIPPTAPTPLQKALARLAKAEAELEKAAEELLDCQGQESWPRYRDARGAYQRARKPRD